jgi:hypothetical protein
LIISSLALTAERIGFQANFERIRRNKIKIRADQKMVPTPGDTRLFAKSTIDILLNRLN